MKSNSKKNLSVNLNPETSLFFAQLIKDGLAEYEQDGSMEEGKVQATITQDEKGKKKIQVRGFSFIIFVADEDTKG